jgi:integrase
MELVLLDRLLSESRGLLRSLSLILWKGHPFANDFSTCLVVIHVRDSLAHNILDSRARPRVTYGRDKYVVGASDSAPMRRLPGNVCRAYRGGLASSVNTEGGELMFSHADGSPWKKSEQSRPIREACEHARITPAVGFHTLRHTWASLAVMARVPLLVVAKNLGHKDTRMVEHHYGHLAPSFITEAIRAGAPVYGIEASKGVVPLR